MADTTAVAIYKLGLDNQQYISAAQAQIAVSNQLVAAQERVVVSEEKVGGASALAANAVQRRVEANDRSIQAARKYAEAVAFVARAEEQNVSTAQMRQTLLDQEAEKLRKTTSALEAKAKAEKDAAQAAHEAEQAAKNLARIEGEHALALKNVATSLGVDRDALIAMANAGNRNAAATLDMMNKIVGLNKALQESKINLLQHAQQTNEVQQAYRGSVATIATQEAAMRKSATTTGLARYEMINLSRQIQDVGVSLAGGQNPFRILIEQGSQIADIFISSKATVKDFFTGIGANLGRLGGGAILGGLVSGIAAIGGTIISAAVSFGSAQRDIQQSLLGIGRAAGVTAKDIQGIAEMSASTFGASISEAREFAAALAQSGTLGNASIRDLTLVSKELAQVLGTDVAGAGKKLQQVFTDPVAGLQQLDKEMGTFDRGVAHTVQTLTAQGKVFEASEVAARALTERMKELGPEIQRTTSFWTAFGNTVSDWWTKLGQFAARRFGFGLAIEEELARAEQALNDANQFFQQTGLGKEMVEEAVTNFNRLTKILETMGKTAEDIRRSRDIGATKGLVQNIIPDIANMQKLKNEAEGLRAALQRVAIDPKFAAELQRAGISANALALAFNRVQGASESYLTVQARATAQFELQMASIRARTAAERESVAAQESALATAGQSLTTEERRLEAERAVTLEIERQAQLHRDNMAALEDQLRIAKARTDSEKESAQVQADINSRLRAGATSMQAQDEASMQAEIRKAQQAGETSKRQAQNAAKAKEEEARAREENIKAIQREQEALLALGRDLLKTGKAAADATQLSAKLAVVAASGSREIGMIGQLSPITRTYVPVGASGAGQALLETEFKMLAKIEANTKKQADAYEKQMLEMTPGTDEFIAKQEEAAAKQLQAAEAQKQAAEQQAAAAQQAYEAAKAAREERISALDEAVKDIVATKLLAGQSAQAVNMLIEQGGIQFGTASTRFQTQLDLYKRAGASNAQIAADIRAGIIGEGAKPSELLAALDSLTDAVNANTDAQLGLSPFYTSQGDRQLGYRGYTVQKGASNIPGAGTGGLNTGGTGGIPGTGPGTGTGTNMPYSPGTGGGIMGGVVNPPGEVAVEADPLGGVHIGTFLNGKYIYWDGTKWADVPNATATLATSSFGMMFAGAYAGAYAFFSGGFLGDPRYIHAYYPAIPLPPGYVPPPAPAYYAEGGVVDRPTMAMFGEAGPEAFVPLKGGAIPVRLTGNNDNKPSTVININAPLVNFMAEPTRDEVRQSAFQASQMLRRQMAG